MKIDKNKFDVISNVVCILALIGVFLYLFIIWNEIPSEIPAHYNALGQIDRMGTKKEILALPIMATIMYVGFAVIEKYPQVWNTGVKVTEENQKRVYRTTKNLLNTIRLIIVLLFTYLTVYTVSLKPLPASFLPIVLILVFGSIIYYILKLVKIK